MTEQRKVVLQPWLEQGLRWAARGARKTNEGLQGHPGGLHIWGGSSCQGSFWETQALGWADPRGETTVPPPPPAFLQDLGGWWASPDPQGPMLCAPSHNHCTIYFIGPSCRISNMHANAKVLVTVEFQIDYLAIIHFYAYFSCQMLLYISVHF